MQHWILYIQSHFTADDGAKAVMQDVVIDYTDGADISGQLVTDANGEAFVDVPAGDYTYTANIIGYQDFMGVTTVAGDTAFVDFTMLELPATFAFVTEYPTGIEFPITLWGYSSDSIPVTFTNIGQGTITIPTANITLDGTGEFVLHNLDDEAVLKTGDDSTVYVKFVPTTLGEQTDTLRINDGLGKTIQKIFFSYLDSNFLKRVII